MASENRTTVKNSFSAAIRELLKAVSVDHDHFALTKAIDQSIAVHPGSFEVFWAARVESIAQHFGLMTERLNVPTSMLGDLKGLDGASLSYDAHSGGFFLASADGFRRIEPTSAEVGIDRAAWTNVELAAHLIESGASSPMLWLRLQNEEDHSDGHHAHHISPLQRLLQILKPDAVDIAALSILAFVISVLAITTPIAAQQLVRAVTFGTLYQPIVVLSLTLFLFLGFMAALQIVSRVVAEVIQQRLFARTAAGFAQRLPKVRLHELSEAKGPEALNRFLEIVTVQKVVSSFLLDGMAVVFTTGIGMTLLALYHPFLLGYDLLLLVLIAVVISLLGTGGTKTSIRESVEKHRVTAWLQDLARCPLAFRLTGAAAFAEARTQQLTGEYLKARNRHFRVLLRQVICIFAIQAVASTALLGLGGFLVLQEQLTLGQLVAAELVVAMIIGSLTKLTKQIEGFFDVMASVDKLGHIADLPLEEPGTEVGQTNADVVAEFPIQALTTVSAGVPSNRIAKWQIRRGRHQSVISANETAKRRLTDVLFGIGESSVNSGFLFGTAPNAVLKDFQRRQVVLIREVEIFTGTVEENIHVGRTHLDHNSIAGAIKKVGLEERIHNLPHGLHTALNPDGTPLSPSEKVLLMVARGISGSPQILVIDRLLDQLPDQSAKEIIAKLQAEDVPWTLVLVTGRRDLAEKVDECIEVD